jgi:anti-sigma regulatory factor (Ser/Thr protein kinase)
VTAIAPHAGFEHAAVFHDGPADLARRLAPAMVDGVGRDEAVLVCLPEPEWSHLARELGAAREAVTYVPPDVRYERPGVAMALVEGFVSDALDAGARAAWSVGQVPLDGTPDDRRWHRYEAAVNEVLGTLPVRAWCAYDTTRVSPASLAAARRTHPAGNRVVAADLGPLPEPDGPPVVDLRPEDAAGVRRVLDAAFGDDVSRSRLEDVRLVATELVTNGLRHGAPPVALRAWWRGREIVLEVTDAGAGLADPYPDLRPNHATTAGGYGYWLIGQLGDRVDVDWAAGRTRVTVGLRADAAAD